MPEPTEPTLAPDLADLLAACALCDRRAFAELYQQTAAKLFAVALRILNNPSLAEEALQESFVKIWQHAGDYRPQRGRPMTWLTSVVRNQTLDTLRRQPRTLPLIDNDGASGTAPDPALAADDSLKRCLERLGTSQRQCVLLAYCEGYTHEELSARLEKPLGTVKTWVRRSLQSLRGCLNELSAS